MIIPKLIQHLHNLIADFSQQTGSFAVDFAEDKSLAEWSLNYNIIKIEFVLTKKEKILCPISTLFCRIYLGKNDTVFYHLPELMEYLDAEDFKCYYFPYMESEERLEACFLVLAAFLKKHMMSINRLAQNGEMCAKVKTQKAEDIIAVFTKDPEDLEIEQISVYGYETYVLLARYTTEGAYREFVCGNYEKALSQYEKFATKGQLTSHERRLLQFIQGLQTDYAALPEACNTIQSVKKWGAPSSEGISILIAAIVCEMILGVLFAGIVAIINAVLSADTMYYAGMEWYYAFVFAGLPAVFGGIAFHNVIRKHLQKKMYQEAGVFESLTNPAWVDKFAKVVFLIALVLTLVINICTPFMSTGFYEEYMTYNEGENLIPIGATTCYYKDVKKVYYSKGVYNEYGDFIARPSYLLEFDDGTVWDSDVFLSVEKFEQHVLPMIEPYYDVIEKIESRNALIE